MKLHHTMGVYANGDRKHNAVKPEHLADHIQYNLEWRPGRAFFVDGVCKNLGYLTQETCDAIETELAANPRVLHYCTMPYQ